MPVLHKARQQKCSDVNIINTLDVKAIFELGLFVKQFDSSGTLNTLDFLPKINT